ncbi:Acyl-CoA N-acyltransferase [Penicillium riverlandense]|uniref:Acyl-CoA N-acyltransferase n=1 Tax=Penicillium riverlandense TaxID=1903569 RepID=UPI002548C243|nr:Acyl-CoA N-acyltransferase [Penicillium riverlandense]KAJ5818140.1 Acyl-CoA N-acyltransferase [Penicillium riverlandense]
MSSSHLPAIAPQTWRRTVVDDGFFISTDPTFLSVTAVNEAFGRDFLYWAKPVPEKVMRQMLYGSLCFGAYYTDRNGVQKQIGLARMITDNTTFAYLTDVYVLPEYQGRGLGRWLIECVAEVFHPTNMPCLRRIMLVTGDQRMQDFYQRIFGMKVVGQEEREDMGKVLTFLCARPNAQP